MLRAAQAGSQQACGRGGRGSAPVQGGRGVATMPSILSSAADDPTDGFLRSGGAVFCQNSQCSLLLPLLHLPLGLSRK